MSRSTPLSDDGGGITDTDADTSRSATPNIKLPLQKMEPAVVRQSGGGVGALLGEGLRRGTTSNTNRSWLGDPDRDSRDSIELEVERGVKLDDMRNYRARHQALQQGHQQEGGIPRSVPNRQSGLPAIGDEESRPQTATSVTSEWNASHPCFPHRNPYVPTNSPLFESTRVIRIQRDFMINGDLSPAYSNTFPDILEPYVSEERFRMVIARVNEDLDKAFNPWNMWNWLDAMIGLFTLWVLEDIIDTYIKRKLRVVEAFLQQQNEELEKAGSQAVFVPLRRTGYMNLDIQIPDPIPPSDEGDQLPPDPDHKFNIASSDAGSAVPTIEINEHIGSPPRPGTRIQYGTADHYSSR
ncbi:hypothetical protein L873DRAFT_520757 [Choiromyces venosus 120613-1]|uniref:Ras modification protein ERF4 n=1 Tax=Choiromyces venosus 120613-1 TaxID=1336337 RepID=A0A3N4KIA9_9PEZI|nr:hypothetical protein L873DRAFT_520757 [Choiromyces venosus 120613-1]